VGWEADVDEALRRPQGALVLAGEHTAGTLAGTLNGAVASGNRAAADVRRLLSL
jgi:monoamine oxidase